MTDRARAAGWVWLAAAIYGLLVYACLPEGVAALDDDFGYLRSVVATLQHGRPWTDDWLEPWAASFSSLSALLYLITRNFYGATYGLLPVLAAVSFGVAVLLLHDRGLKPWLAIVLAFSGLAFPTVFWKTIQYTGLALYLPCLLGAIWACERPRWSVFLIVWLAALATRQSALAWGMLPLVIAAGNWRAGIGHLAGRAFWRPALVATAGAVVFVILWSAMNRTHAQAVLGGRVFARVSLTHVLQIGMRGLGVYFVMAGIGLLVLRLNRPGFAGSRSWRSPAVRTVLALAAVVICSFDLRTLVLWEHGAMSGPAGWLLLKFLVLAGAAGWLFRGGALRPAMAAGALAALALLCSRGAVWDYYFFDLAALGLFGVRLRDETVAVPAPSEGRWRLAAGLVLAIAVVVNGLLILDFKAAMDRGWAVCRLGEQALREGRLAPAELSFAPFGFRAWHLYPWYVRHEGRDSADIAGFDCYLRPGAIEVGQGYSRLLHVLPRFCHEPPADRRNLIAAGGTRFLWFFRGEYYLLRFKTEAEAPPVARLPPDYCLQPFPLNEAEWSETVSAPN